MDEPKKPPTPEEWAHEAPTTELLEWFCRDRENGWDMDPKYAAARVELDFRIPRRRA